MKSKKGDKEDEKTLTKDDIKSKRRNRANHNERNFICGCSKSYLRYIFIFRFKLKL